VSETPERTPSLDRVTSLAQGAANAPVSAELHGEGLRRLLGALPVTRRKTTRATWRLALAALVAIAASVTVFSRTRPLRYEITGGVSSGESYVSAPANSPSEVRFSDGSSIVATPGTQLRIEDTRRDGARVLVERGTTTAHVTHGHHSSWLFVAGPFDVHVTGTRLTVTWDPAKEEVDVTLHEGSVEIDSPVGPSRYQVRAGHRFHASVLEGTVKIEEVPATSPQKPDVKVTVTATAGPAESATTTLVPAIPMAEPRGAPAATPSPLTTSAARSESWAELVRRGAFEAVVVAAKERGLAACLTTCAASDVRALADAARYVGDGETAKKSLLSLRSRFPGSKFAAAAGFLLGRTAESAGDLRDADRWYRTYLTESSSGEFGADALAGRMRTSTALDGAVAGAAVAREYLRRYPDGVHRTAARKLAGPD
jgi:TolA-binding protein